jgi:uncharacterized protein YdiU (UPF0061 family)
MTTAPIPFDNSYARLPEHFYSRLAPTTVAEPGPIRVNRALAEYLNIDADWLASPEGTAAIAGNAVPEGAEPLATVYAGHQFGNYNPQLGDGRAILLGEVVARDGQRFDIQLKGSGPTPYSRGGDGRSPLGPVLREYIVSEAMYALGIPTTRALAAVTTGEPVARERFEPGAILARVASSHLRIGTLQFFAARGDLEALQTLVDHVLARHYPDAGGDNRALTLLNCVIDAQARLVARWQLVGFIHGVMNTDNMLLCGETIDYGPCAFMDSFHPDTVYSSIDHAGRYAYRNQPGIAHWNLAVLAQTLLPILAEDQDQAVEIAQGAVDVFPDTFMAAHTEGLGRKLGLAEVTGDDTRLIEDLFTVMAEQELDFTLTFRHLADLADPHSEAAKVDDLFTAPEPLQTWITRWQTRLAQDSATPAERQRAMYRANPAFIPRNHQVQAAISAAADDGDFSVFHRLVERLEKPMAYSEADSDLAVPPRPEQVVRQTFCGT